MSKSPKKQSAEDRSALVAVTVFPLIIIAAFAFAFFSPKQASVLGPWVTILLGIIMFGMGLTLTPGDFKLIAKRPIPVVIGVIAQYIIMPGLAFALSKIIILVMGSTDVSNAIAVGVVLVGCAPGGTSSNVVSYLSKADVALSVTMTSISTLLAPIMTPLLTSWLAGSYMPINGKAMALSIVQVVLLPIIAGVVIRLLAHSLVEMILPILPWISTFGIAGVLLAVVSGSVNAIKSAGLIVFVVVITHNLCGYALGFWFSRVLGVSVRGSRTTSIEVGMQNSGLAAQLATVHFATQPATALPGAIFSTWHNISGALLAMYYRRTAATHQDEVDAKARATRDAKTSK